jgi:hypothetical protein
MRRTEFLITELRNSTDNKDRNGVSDAELIAYLNYGQKFIQNLIFKVNPKADIFQADADYPWAADGKYTLPEDIYAVNAILQVSYLMGDMYLQIKRVDQSEPGIAGYYTRGNELVVTGHQNLPIRVTYFRALPRMDKRWGQISGIAGNVLTMSNWDADHLNIDDHITADGRVAEVVSSTGSTITLASVPSGMASGQFILAGENSVNISELPDACETYLLDYARQRIYTRNNYEDAGKQVYFTDKQKDDLQALFANNQKDVLIPPITDYDALDF